MKTKVVGLVDAQNHHDKLVVHKVGSHMVDDHLDSRVAQNLDLGHDQLGELQNPCYNHRNQPVLGIAGEEVGGMRVHSEAGGYFVDSQTAQSVQPIFQLFLEQPVLQLPCLAFPLYEW